MRKKQAQVRLVPEGFVAVCLEPLASYRLSRELQKPIFCAQFGPARKPASLRPLRQASAASNPPELWALGGKEKGHGGSCGAPRMSRSSTAGFRSYSRRPEPDHCRAT